MSLLLIDFFLIPFVEVIIPSSEAETVFLYASVIEIGFPLALSEGDVETLAISLFKLRFLYYS